jgi:DNA-binding transcriptional LysR family regulator
MICYERGGMIRLVIDEWFRRAGVSPHIAMELGNAEAIKRLVEAGIGITSAVTVKAEVRAGRLVALPLAPRLTRELVVVRRRDKAVNPALQALLAALEGARQKATQTLAPKGRGCSRTQR